MRYKILFQGESNYYPKDFDSILAYCLYKKLEEVSGEYFDNFRYYNFSYFHLDDYYNLDDGSLYSNDSEVYVVISSVDDYFLDVALSVLILDQIESELGIFKVIGFEILDTPDFSKDSFTFISLSPIKIDSVYSQYGLLEYLSNRLIESYSEYFDVSSRDLALDFQIYNIKRYQDKDSPGQWDIYYLEFNLIGDADLIEFAWDVGLGELNYKGFGMLELND